MLLVSRQKRKVQQQRQKLQEKMRLKMILPGDTREVETDMEVFSLANIKSKQVITAKVTMSVHLTKCAAMFLVFYNKCYVHHYQKAQLSKLKGFLYIVLFRVVTFEWQKLSLHAKFFNLLAS